MRTRLFLAAMLLLASAGLPSGRARADAPSLLPVQGFLTDSAGTALDGPSDITFSLYAAEVGGTPIYVETQSVLVDQGYFTAYVGDAVPLDLALFRDAGTVFVGMRVGADPEMSPRAQLGSVPFAAFAQYGTWAGLSGVPADLADGDDAGPTYAAGAGITITGGTIAADTAAVQARITGTCPVGQSVVAILADGSVTCAADRDTTYTAESGSGITMTGTVIGADRAVLQARVTGTCAAGQSIASIGADGTVTCAATGSTYAAGAGLTLTGTTFAVNAAAVQTRVAGTCAVGSSIRVVNSDGTVTCESDNDTTYSAVVGSGIVLTGTALSTDTTVLQSRVTGTCAAGQAVTAIAANGAVTCGATGSSYTAGTGLTLTGTTFAVDTAVLQARVSGVCAVGSSIRVISPTGTVTCEVDDAPVYTGAAGSGVVVTGTSIATDTNVLQSRVTGTCAAGQAVTAIAANGGVTCASTVDSYTAGTGLTLTAGQFAVNTTTIQARVTGTCPVGQAVTAIGAAGTVTCASTVDTYAAGAGLTLTGTTFSIGTGAITGAMLADGTLNENDLSVPGFGTVTSTTDETVQSHFMGDLGGITTARVAISVNGTTGRGTTASGGAGTMTVTCGTTNVATIALEAGGSRPWLHITPSITLSTCTLSQLDIKVRAAAAGAPVYVRSLDVLWGH